MKNLFICLLYMLTAGCTLVFEPSDDATPVYYEGAIVVDYCMYDPMPLDSDLRYCDSYSNAECCVWEQSHTDSWYCEYEWCFYWDTCEWEYIDSECWW